MKKKNLALVALLTMTLFSCEPMDEHDYWIGNAVIHADWSNGNLETGRRPVDIDSCFLGIYPHNENKTGDLKYFPFDNTEYALDEDIYDFMLIHNTKYIKRTELYKTTEIVLPTSINETMDQIIVENPNQMIYAGLALNDTVKEDKQSSFRVNVIRLLKKINFVCVIGDKKELNDNMSLNLSGVANKMKIWNQKIDTSEEGIVSFSLKKRGKHLNNENMLTSYQGSVYILGIAGRNILYVKFNDADGKEQELKLNLTPYLINWNTEEVTLRMFVNVWDSSHVDAEIKGWELGNTTDVIFDY